MIATVFSTPGKLDLRAITSFGMSAKPNTTSPIGYFGTGLKYAIAVLAREKIPVTIYVGLQRWTLETHPTNFRGADFDIIRLVRHKKLLPPTKNDLPYTTQFGKNWKMWQAFRELYANTLDEGGKIFSIQEEDPQYEPSKDRTLIIVEGQKMHDEYLNRDEYFLPDGLRERADDGQALQVFPRESKYVYYRGLRVHDLKEPSQNTYNILRQIELTEDRTAKSAWDVEYYIRQHIIEREQQPTVLERTLTAPTSSFEGRLSYAYDSHTPSEAIKERQASLSAGNFELASNISGHLKKFEPKPPPDLTWRDKLIDAIDVDDSLTAWNIIAAHKADVIRHLRQPLPDNDLPEMPF